MLHFLVFQVAQTKQTQILAVLIPIILSALAIVISYSSFRVAKKRLKIEHDKQLQAEKERHELEQQKRDLQLKKFATKIFVMEQISKIDIETTHIRNNLDDYKKTNEREHDRLWQEVNTKLDHIIKLVS